MLTNYSLPLCRRFTLSTCQHVNMPKIWIKNSCTYGSARFGRIGFPRVVMILAQVTSTWIETWRWMTTLTWNLLQQQDLHLPILVGWQRHVSECARWFVHQRCLQDPGILRWWKTRRRSSSFDGAIQHWHRQTWKEGTQQNAWCLLVWGRWKKEEVFFCDGKGKIGTRSLCDYLIRRPRHSECDTEGKFMTGNFCLAHICPPNFHCLNNVKNWANCHTPFSSNTKKGKFCRGSCKYWIFWLDSILSSYQLPSYLGEEIRRKSLLFVWMTPSEFLLRTWYLYYDVCIGDR